VWISENHVSEATKQSTDSLPTVEEINSIFMTAERTFATRSLGKIGRDCFIELKLEGNREQERLKLRFKNPLS
jgi:hypothetical protein